MIMVSFTDYFFDCEDNDYFCVSNYYWHFSKNVILVAYHGILILLVKCVENNSFLPFLGIFFC